MPSTRAGRGGEDVAGGDTAISTRTAPRIRVTVRLRPSAGGESGAWEHTAGGPGSVRTSLPLGVAAGESEDGAGKTRGKTTHVHVDGGCGQVRRLRFSEVLSAKASQAAVYRSTAQGIAERLFKGTNACWLAVGSPQSGKTYSTVGELGEFARMGVIARVASDVFDKLQTGGNKGDLMLSISCFLVSGGHADRQSARDLLSSPPMTRPVVLGSAMRPRRTPTANPDDTGIDGLVSLKVAVLSDVSLSVFYVYVGWIHV